MLRVKALLVAVGIAVASFVALPQAQQNVPPELALTAQLPIDTAVRSGQLPNGLKYFIRNNSRPANRVSMRLAVNAGAVQEENDQRGLAHFIEHMAFNGTQNFKPGELVSFLETIGARFGPHVNASTSFDETVYMLDLPSDRPGYVDKGLLVLHDFASGLSFIPEEVEKERGVVLEEWRGRLGAGSRLTDKQLPILTAGSRYAERLPIGLPEIIQKAPREKLMAFYQKWYRPDLMAVTFAGDVPVDEAEALIKKNFGSIPAAKGPIPTVDQTVPAHKETLYTMDTDPEAQGWSVSMIFQGKQDKDTTVGGYRKSLVRQLVSDMLNMRLREIARRNNAPFLAASSGTDSLGRTLEMFEIDASVPEGQITEGLGAIMVEARRMQQFGFTKDELDRARSAMLAGYERAFKEKSTSESPSYAMEYVRHFLNQEPIPGIDFEYKIASTYLPTVTVDEVSAVAKSFITDENRVVMGVAPEKKDKPAPTVDMLKTTLARANSATVDKWADATAGRELVEKVPAAGKVASRKTVDSVGATVLTLSNGVEVWLKPTDFKNDQIMFTAYSLGGAANAAPADYKSASIAAAMVGIGGMGGLSPVDLSKMLSGKIAQASPSVGDYTTSLNGTSTPKDFETALKLNYLAITQPNFTPEAFELLKRRLAGSLENRDQNPRAVFGEKVEQVNTSNHYSAQALKAADVNTLNLNTMRSFYQSRFANAADFTYFFVGAFKVEEVTPLIEQWIGSLPSTGKKTAAMKDMGVKFPPAVVKEEVKKGKEPASQTVISFFADPGQDEFEMHRARAAASVLSIRLREILREELGGTYGVSVGLDNPLPLKGYGSMVIQFGSSPANVDKLIKATMAEIERLKTEGPSLEDVNKVKELERRDIETNQKQNSYWMGSLQTVHMLGWDPAGINRRNERTEKLTQQNIQEMFRKYFPMERHTEVTLNPE